MKGTRSSLTFSWSESAEKVAPPDISRVIEGKGEEKRTSSDPHRKDFGKSGNFVRMERGGAASIASMECVKRKVRTCLLL